MTVSLYKDNLKIEESKINEQKFDNVIEFDFLGYHMIIDLDTKTLTRENEEFVFYFDFLKKESTVTLKQEKLDLNIIVDDCFFKIDNTQITLEYSIETEDEKTKLIITKEEEK